MRRLSPVALWEIVLAMLVVGGGVFALLERPWQAKHDPSSNGAAAGVEPYRFSLVAEASPLSSNATTIHQSRVDAAVAPVAHWAAMQVPVGDINALGQTPKLDREIKLLVTPASDTEKDLANVTRFKTATFSKITAKFKENLDANVDEITVAVDGKYGIPLTISSTDPTTAIAVNVKLPETKHQLQVLRDKTEPVPAATPAASPASATPLETHELIAPPATASPDEQSAVPLIQPASFLQAAAATQQVVRTVSSVYSIEIAEGPLEIVRVDDTLQIPRGPYRITVILNRPLQDEAKLTSFKLFKLGETEGDTAEAPNLTSRTAENGRREVVLNFSSLDPAEYRLTVTKDVADEFGNTLATDYVRNLFKPVASLTSGPLAGLKGPSGPAIEFPDYTEPRPFINGFNPEDKVESRVVRLYYYRDAHRVAQIINRNSQSYNKAGVERQRQLADAKRREGDQLTLDRKKAEQEAIRAAQQSRIKERELATAQQSLQTALREAQVAQQQAQVDETELIRQGKGPNKTTNFDLQAAQLAQIANSLANKISRLESEIQSLRNEEATQNDEAQEVEGREKLAREEQFRLEVAAAKEDPDTYAAGNIKSIDPVAQTSVSVIGEGVLHLRGPLKGINVIRNMIHQIDAPAGQVRVSVHTVQINGERADRMEIVGDSIQKHIDQARFLTLRSGELLRKSVVHVASRKAEEGRALAPGFNQADRDQRYLHAFFGQDFIDELRAMNSEMLHSGNKILSLHSMDTTSLSSALIMMSLAKNSTRQEILGEFEQLCQTELPAAEQKYIESGMYCAPGKHGKHKQLPLCYLGQNASFESLKGFFNAESTHDDTLTPLQREFIRLAQIFKSRVVTEMEYRQRVTERAIIEERLGDHRAQLVDAANREQNARNVSEDKFKELTKQESNVETAVTTIGSEIARLSAWDSWKKIRSVIANYGKNVQELQRGEKSKLNIEGKIVTLENQAGDVAATGNENEVLALYRRVLSELHEICRSLEESYDQQYLSSIGITSQQIQDVKEVLNACQPTEEYYVKVAQLKALYEAADRLHQWLQRMQIAEDQQNTLAAGNKAYRVLNDRYDSYTNAFNAWLEFRVVVENALKKLNRTPTIDALVTRLNDTNESYRALLKIANESEQADDDANRARRPLDHKKFLDQLIGEVEDKYVELLDGTRAHVANIDNYIKRITTALDDDFNNQFYYPVFRSVREASTYYDVQFGQTETTSVLANNRGFAKVSPQATMEFDLPERDIVLTEAMNGAKAMIDEYGALVNDPAFLSLSKMKAGSGPATPSPGTTNGASTVRTVLPGLEGTTSEQFMAQNGPGRGQFGAALENLIPDPAVYKFETGTGFEIRPVLQPDGQAVVFGFHYMYTTNVREPIRPDEKHLGRVKRHFIDTDVQLSNFELREVSRYQVVLKAARTSKGVPLLEDIPVAGVLFRPLPSQESSLQQNQILAQATVFPTLFDLMGLRWAPAVTDLDTLRLTSEEFVVRGRRQHVENRVYDHSSEQVDGFLRIPPSVRRPDLYRGQDTIPDMHPNGYRGPGLDRRDSTLQEGYRPGAVYRNEQFMPAESPEGSNLQPRGRGPATEGTEIRPFPLRGQINPPQNAPPLRNGS